MLVGMGLAGIVCVVLAVWPAGVLPAVGRVASTIVGSGGPAITGTVTLQLRGIAGSLSPLLLTFALLAGAVVTAGVVRVVAVRRARRSARLWDCGAGPLSARMEYTATSFAEPLQRVFDNVVAPETDVDVTHHEESRYLVAAVEFRRRVPDRIERRLYQPVLATISAWGQIGRLLATGSVHRYLGYGFYAVTALLIVLAMTR
jgi:hypothetical protein